MTLREFTTKFLFPPSDLELQTFKILDEEGGGEVDGVLVRIQAGDPPGLYRKVTIFTQTILDLAEDVLRADNTLREGHATDLFKVMSMQRAEKRTQVCEARIFVGRFPGFQHWLPSSAPVVRRQKTPAECLAVSCVKSQSFLGIVGQIAGVSLSPGRAFVFLYRVCLLFPLSFSQVGEVIHVLRCVRFLVDGFP